MLITRTLSQFVTWRSRDAMASDSMEPPVHERAQGSKTAPVYRVAVIQMHPKVKDVRTV